MCLQELKHECTLGAQWEGIVKPKMKEIKDALPVETQKKLFLEECFVHKMKVTRLQNPTGPL